MKYVVAVSGGVDSVVLLDVLSKTKHRLVVAHVSHGIRDDSDDDARFVEGLAKHYKVPYVSTNLALGKSASEEQAREQRYKFLFDTAEQFDAVIATAHHLDDLVETVAINLTRGTGWRGLNVLSRQGIERPLISLPKSSLLRYAMKHRLEWVEDSTNATDVYLRNRLRKKIQAKLPRESLEQIAKLRARQLQLAKDIAGESTRLANKHAGSRHYLSNVGELEAQELLAAQIIALGAPRPLRHRLHRALLAIKTAKAGTTHNVGDGVSLTFTTRKFHISVV